MDHPEVISYLNSFVNFESQLHKLRPEDFNLNRIQQLLDLAGLPGKNLKIIHVAGTKGKGSTCAFIASILHRAGFRVGLYTSPHLHRVNERIRVLTPENLSSKDNFSGSISDDEMSVIVNFLRPLTARILNEGGLLTYFEVLTVMAICYFAKAQVDVVILETGLGGRLDATNAMDSAIAVITPISLDHTRILGSLLSQIAVEKAGIIKSTHQRLVIAPQEKEVMDIMLLRCREFGISPVLVCPDKYDDLKTGLKGKHQMINAACAIEVITLLKTLGMKVSDEAIEAGLKQVCWAGRFELLKKNPDVIVDCAHNAASAKALAATIMEVCPYRRVILILGISQDKDKAAIGHHLRDSAEHIILTKAQHPRAHFFTDSEGKEYFGNKSFEIIEHLPAALEKALPMAGPQGIVIVTGSVFIVAEAIDYLCTNTKV